MVTRSLLTRVWLLHFLFIQTVEGWKLWDRALRVWFV